MVTQLGIFLRKLRLDSREIMKEMAEKLGVSSSFLSAVENGKKKMPSSWKENLIKLYNLDKEKQDKLNYAIEESKTKIEIDIEKMNIEKKKLLFSFARKLEYMNEKDVDALKNFLKKEDELV